MLSKSGKCSILHGLWGSADSQNKARVVQKPTRLPTSNCAHRLFPFSLLAQIFTIGTAVLDEHAGFKVFHSEPLALDKKNEVNI